MKKQNLIIGVVYTLVGVICLLTALLTETRLDGLLFSFSGAGMASGLLTVCRYFYWNVPENKERYREKLENEQIQLNDELKEKLRDKSGRYAYILGLLVICVTMMLLSVLGALEMVSNSRIMILYLGGYLVFQYAAGIFIFNHLLKKY